MTLMTVEYGMLLAGITAFRGVNETSGSSMAQVRALSLMAVRLSSGALADRARGESGSIPVPPSYSYWPSPFPVFPRVDVAKLSDHPSFLPTPRLAFLFIRFRLLN